MTTAAKMSIDPSFRPKRTSHASRVLFDSHCLHRSLMRFDSMSSCVLEIATCCRNASNQGPSEPSEDSYGWSKEVFGLLDRSFWLFDRVDSIRRRNASTCASNHPCFRYPKRSTRPTRRLWLGNYRFPSSSRCGRAPCLDTGPRTHRCTNPMFQRTNQSLFCHITWTVSRKDIKAMETEFSGFSCMLSKLLRIYASRDDRLR